MAQTVEKRGSEDVCALASDLRIVIGRLKRRLRERSPFGDLTWSQIAVLGRLERDGPATVTTLAKAEGMRPQSMGANVAVLEAAGLLCGAPDPSDRRQTILCVTAACRATIEAARAAREDWLQSAIRTHLDRDERATLLQSIALLERIAGA